MKVSKLLVLGVLVMAMPLAVLGADIAGTKGVVPAAPNIYYLTDTIHYHMTLSNNHATENIVVESVTDTLPNGVVVTLDSTADASYPDFPFNLPADTTQVYDISWPIAGVVAGQISNRFSFAGYQESTVNDYFAQFVDKGSLIIDPDTLVGITVTAPTGFPGHPTNLIVTEQNTGQDPLFNVEVKVYANEGSGDVLLDTLTAPPDSGDGVILGVLEDEEWSWTIGPFAVNGFTTYTAIGYGEDLAGNPVTFPFYQSEKAEATADIEINPALTIVKNGPAYSKHEGPWGAGDTITYDVTITIGGDWPLILDTLVDNIAGDQSGLLPAGSQIPGTVIGPLTYTYDPQPADDDPLVNIVTVTAHAEDYPAETATNNDNHSVILVHPDFTVAKICLNDPVPEDEDAQFEITITNTGDIPLIITSDESELAGPLDLVSGQPIVQVVTREITDGSVSNTINVVATLPAEYDLSNVIERSDTAECTTQGDTFCSFTQGFYGNKGGKKCGGLKTADLIDELIDDGADPVIVGTGARTITLGSSDCIIDLLPAGGPAAVLPVGNFGCPVGTLTAIPDSILKDFSKKESRFNNVLIGQVVALSLNVRLSSIPCLGNGETDSPLGSYVIPGIFEVEEDVYLCVEGADGCIRKYLVPQSVKGLSVDQLLIVANQALAGIDVGNIGDIANAAGFINEAFDECGSVVTCLIDPFEICDDGCDNDFDGEVDEEECEPPIIVVPI